MLNLALREWGHQYLYHHEDLKMAGNQAGFLITRNPKPNHSEFPELAGLESRGESLAIEVIKESRGDRRADGVHFRHLAARRRQPAIGPRFPRRVALTRARLRV